jgi:hypothetical protein
VLLASENRITRLTTRRQHLFEKRFKKDLKKPEKARQINVSRPKKRLKGILEHPFSKSRILAEKITYRKKHGKKCLTACKKGRFQQRQNKPFIDARGTPIDGLI